MNSRSSSTLTYSRAADRRVYVPVLAAAALVAAIILAVGIGPVYISPPEVVRAIFGSTTGTSQVIVEDIRLPRVLVGGMVGASLAMSGALLQGVTRNPLADPHVFGISAGAGVAAVAGIIYFPNVVFWEIQLVAFAGGLLAGLMAYAMAWRGGVAPARLALAGVAVTSILTAVLLALLVREAFAAQVGLRWITGGLLSGRNWNDFEAVAPYVAAGTIGAILLSRQINVIALGDDVAASLGQRVQFVRFAATAVAALLASSAVSVAGLVGFVGLIVPHMVRLLIGSDYRAVIPTSALAGALLLIVADTGARTLFDPTELPVGVVTAVIGGPVFIYLIRSRS